jgi:hypothetical protein
MKPNPLNPLFAKWTFRICGSLRACRTPDKVSGLWFRDPAWTEAPQALCRASIQLIHNHFPCKMSFNAQDKTCMDKREKKQIPEAPWPRKMLRQDLLQAPSLEPDVALCTLLAEARRCAEQGTARKREGEARTCERIFRRRNAAAKASNQSHIITNIQTYPPFSSHFLSPNLRFKRVNACVRHIFFWQTSVAEIWERCRWANRWALGVLGFCFVRKVPWCYPLHFGHSMDRFKCGIQNWGQVRLHPLEFANG